MPCHVGWPTLAWCDRHHLLPIRLLVRQHCENWGGQESREFSTATTAGLAEFPRPWLKKICRKASPTGGGAVQCVCRYADAQIRSRSARCRRNSCPFTTCLHDERRAVSSPTAAGYRLGKSAKMHANPEDEHGRCRNDAEAMHCD